MGPDKRCSLKGRLTPGDPDMELRDPENHEDGDPEVRDGRRGKGRQRPEKQSQRQTRGGTVSRCTGNNGRDRETEKRQRPRVTQTQGHTARLRPLKKWAQKERTKHRMRRMERETCGVGIV